MQDAVQVGHLFPLVSYAFYRKIHFVFPQSSLVDESIYI